MPFFFLSAPYASAAAVGSLIIRLTSRPAILPASLVAWRCASLKYAGTVITASLALIGAIIAGIAHLISLCVATAMDSCEKQNNEIVPLSQN